MKKRIILVLIALTCCLLLTGCGNNNTNVPITKTGDWFQNVLVIPVGYILEFFTKSCSNNFAVGILLTTIVVRTICWPIYAKSNDFMLKMNILNPELQRLQAKYATRKDAESQQQMQQEMMKLYKKYDMNPLGCLVSFLQMPVFLAVYQVVSRITISSVVDEATGLVTKQAIFFQGIEVNNKLFGFIDLSKGSMDILPQGFILPLLVGITMFVLQYFSSKKPKYAKNIPAQPNAKAGQTEKMMKIMNYGMVIMMVFMSLSNGALAFYWVVGNVYSLGQQIISRQLSNRKYEKMKNQGIIGG